MLQALSQFRWLDVVDLILVAIIIYQALLVLKGTQALQVLAGMFLLFVVYLGARRLELFTLEWLLDGFIKSFILIIIILFQADIRRVLSRMGRKALAPPDAPEPTTIEEICDAVDNLVSHRIGALMVLERRVSLAVYLEGAIKLDAAVTKELLTSLFWPHNPTHDGAVIIQGDRILAAGCLLPLSANPNLDPALGTRHRAGVGLTEQTDALALIISESFGHISLARGGGLTQNLSRLQLRQALKQIMEPTPDKKESWLDRLARFFNPQ